MLTIAYGITCPNTVGLTLSHRHKNIKFHKILFIVTGMRNSNLKDASLFDYPLEPSVSPRSYQNFSQLCSLCSDPTHHTARNCHVRHFGRINDGVLGQERQYKGRSAWCRHHGLLKRPDLPGGLRAHFLQI